MPILPTFNTTMELLQKVLDLRTTNQQVISSNIANAETPGYSAVTLEFEDQLKSALSGRGPAPVAAHPDHIPLASSSLGQVEGRLRIDRDATGIGDENSVSVDGEMVKLSENQLLYEAAVTMMNKKLALLKYAANDGR